MIDPSRWSLRDDQPRVIPHRAAAPRATPTPAPDHRAALERLETAASAIVAAEDQLSVDDDYARALYIGAIPQLRAALTHARKVLHVP